MNLVISVNVCGQWVPCVRNSYSFMPILLKLHKCFRHGLKMCMWFGYSPQNMFDHFFRKLNLVIFSGVFIIKVCLFCSG